MVRHFDTPSHAFLYTLRDCLDHPEYVNEPRGKETREITNYAFTVLNPSDGPIITADPERNEVIRKYTEAEFECYASGTRLASDFAKCAPFWLSVANPDGTVNSAYGYKIWYERNCANRMTQWEWCKESLYRDPDTRQAVMFFGTPASQYPSNRDQACTLSGVFQLRDGRLNLSMTMRSNDVVRGLCYDMPWFCHLQIKMAQELGVPLGRYHHFAHSMHVYEGSVTVARRMLG